MEDFLKEEYDRLGLALFVSNHVIDRIPYFLGDNREAYNSWRQRVSRLLEVDLGNILVVGSGSVGCSLNPRKNFAVFHDGSDIDIAVISTYHFDLSWRVLRRLRRGDAANNDQWEAVKLHQTTLIYWGCIATDKLLEVMPFAAQWLEASIQISGLPEIGGRSINFRIYRDFASLRSYHESGVRKVMQ